MRFQIRKLARSIAWLALIGSRSTAAGTSWITPSTTKQRLRSTDSSIGNSFYLLSAKSKYSPIWQFFFDLRQSVPFNAYPSRHEVQTSDLVSHVAQSDLHRTHLCRWVSKEDRPIAIILPASSRTLTSVVLLWAGFSAFHRVMNEK
jgi:hypothetical protein